MNGFPYMSCLTLRASMKAGPNFWIKNFLLVTAADDAQTPQAPRALEDDPTTFYTARVDIKKFAQFLMGEQVNPVRVICSKY